MRIRRMSLLTMLTVLVLVISACSGTPEGEGAGATTGGGEETTATTAAAGDTTAADGAADTEPAETAPAGTTEVTFWQQDFTDEEDEWYQATVDAFNESQDEFQVVLDNVPADAWDQRMTAAQAAGNAPDLYTMNYGSIANAARTSQITSLADLISAEAWDDLDPTVRETVTVDGEEYAYPLLVEPSAVLWYRTDLFEEAGLDGPPTSWDQLQEYAEQLSSGEVFGLRLAQNATDMAWSTWGLQLNVAGHFPITDDWSAPDMEGYEPLLQAFQGMFASGAIPPPDELGYADSTPFIDGQYAMMANGSWAASQILADASPELVENIAAAPMPTFSGESGETTATLGGWTWVVDGNSDAAEGAAQFIEWALGGDPENVLPFFETTVYSKVAARVSVREAISEVPDVNEVNPWNSVIQEEIVPNGAAEPAYPFNISLAMGEAIEAAMQGAPVDQALEEAAGKIQTEIDNSGLAGTGPGS